MLGHAVRRGVIHATPADKLMANERPNVGAGRRRFLARVEMQRLLEEARPPYRLAIAVGLFSGLRVSEAPGLVWADVDSETENIRARFQMGAVTASVVG